MTDALFISEITTPGTIWRWKEDPQQVIYQTLPYPGGSQDSATWQKNTVDQVDNEQGVGLYNYTRLADYTMKPHHKHESRQRLPGGWTFFGRHNHTNFVSQFKKQHNTYSWNTAFLLTQIVNTLSLIHISEPTRPY